MISIFCHLGEACWWTIHPASKQRSEGEKVRIGDDLILVSVSSERYLVGLFFKQVNQMVEKHNVLEKCWDSYKRLLFFFRSTK